MARVLPEQPFSRTESVPGCSQTRVKPRATVDPLADVQKPLGKLRPWEEHPELSPAHPINQLGTQQKPGSGSLPDSPAVMSTT